MLPSSQLTEPVDSRVDLLGEFVCVVWRVEERNIGGVGGSQFCLD